MKYKLPKTEKISPIQPPCKKTIYDTKADAVEAIRYMTENRACESECISNAQYAGSGISHPNNRKLRVNPF